MSNKDLYCNSLFWYHSQNTLHVSKWNSGHVGWLTESVVEPIHNLAVDFETVIAYGRRLTDAENELGREEELYTEIVPRLPSDFFQKFATVQTIDLDMCDLAENRLLEMDTVFRNCKMLPSLKRLSLQITGKIYLPMTLITEVLNDDSTDRKFKLRWWEQFFVELYFFNLGRSRMEIAQEKEMLDNKPYREVVQKIFLEHLARHQPDTQVLMQDLIDMSNEFNDVMDGEFHMPLATFMEDINGILGVKGKMMTVTCGDDFVQHWFWDLDKADEYARDEIQFTRGLDSIEVHD